MRAAQDCVCGTAWVVQKVQACGGGLLAERARWQGAHLARRASAHLVGGRVTDEGVIFNLHAHFSQNYRFHVTALSKALLAIIYNRARRMSR